VGPRREGPRARPRRVWGSTRDKSRPARRPHPCRAPFAPVNLVHSTALGTAYPPLPCSHVP